MESKNTSPFEVVPFTKDEQASYQEKYSDELEKHVHIGLSGKTKYSIPESLAKEARNIYNIPIRPTDIFVDSFPRAGTTWTQELVWLLANDLDFEKAKSIPLTERYLFLEQYTLFKYKAEELSQLYKDDPEKMKMWSIILTPAEEILAKTPSPRFIKSHLPVSLLPKDALETAKVVYVARDPRDIAVSFYHFIKENKGLGLQGNFKSFYYDHLTKNLAPWTPLLDHIKEAWELRNHPNFLFIFYEELSEDLQATARRVAQFLGREYSEEQLQQLVDYLHFSNFQKNSAVDLHDLKTLGIYENKEKNFIRKGKAGGWREHFDEEMRAHAARWMRDGLRGSDLRFPQPID